MALVIGLLVGLFVLLGLALLKAGFRNPRLLLAVTLGIIGLYQLGEDRLARDLEGVEITTDGISSCPPNQVRVTIRNQREQAISGFRFTLHGYRPDYSDHVAYASHGSDRIVGPGTNWTECWLVEDLEDLPQTQHRGLRWEVSITSIELDG